MSDNSVDMFTMGLAFVGDQPLVTVVGDIDLVTASSFAGVLNGLLNDGYHTIVADLAGLTFVDARGLNVLAEVATRIAGVGGTLTVHSVPAFTRRMFGITGLSELVVFGTSAARPEDRAADDQQLRVGETDTTALAGPQRALARSSTELIDAALRLVTTLADATVENADGVSVTLERHGRLMTVAASNDEVLTMDRHQYETGEGPCLDAKALGRNFYTESLAEETRWPRFVPLALDQGIHSILSSPLMTRDRPQGALNMYSSATRAFGTRQQELAALFAKQASEILTTSAPDLTDDESNQRFGASLAARQTIHQAQGVLMARRHLTADAAIRSIFHEAREVGITVLAHAIDIVASLHPDDRRS